MKVIKHGENILNVPNAISFYRLAVFPVILYTAVTGNERLFVILLCISLVSDVLDGNIARIFKLQTRFGAALDNLADIVTYFMALYGIFAFRWDDIQPHAWLLYIFLSFFVISYIVAFIRFRRVPGLHLYSAVSAGYFQGVFFFILFVWGFIDWLYYIAVGLGAIAYIEKIIILFRLDDIKPGVKGLYWLLQKERESLSTAGK